MNKWRPIPKLGSRRRGRRHDVNRMERRIEPAKGGLWVIKDTGSGYILSTHGRRDEAQFAATEVLKRAGGGLLELRDREGHEKRIIVESG